MVELTQLHVACHLWDWLARGTIHPLNGQRNDFDAEAISRPGAGMPAIQVTAAIHAYLIASFARLVGIPLLLQTLRGGNRSFAQLLRV